MKFNLKIWIFVSLFLISIINVTYAQDSGVCCLEDNGFCSSNKLTANCEQGGGSVLGGGSCYNPDRTSTFSQCQLVGCVFPATRECSFVSSDRCNYLRGTVDTTITTQTQCDNYEPTIIPQADTNVVRNVCSSDERKILGVNAGNNIVSEIEVCSNTEKCVDTNGNPGCVSTSCIVDEDTIIRTYNTREEIFYIEKTKIISEMLGVKINSDSKTIDLPSERRDGESWCMIYGSDDGKNWDLLPKYYTNKYVELGEASSSDKYAAVYMKSDYKQYSAGQRHSIYRCVDGNIVVEPGDLFRNDDGICLENSEPEYYLINQGNDEKWATCQARNVNDREKYIDALKEVENNVYSPVLNEAGGARNLRTRPGSTLTSEDSRIQDYADYRLNDGFSHAILVDNWDRKLKSNSDDFITCRAKYPIGNEFYESVIGGIPSPEIRCGSCGNGIGRCDDNECYRKGDCTFDGGTGVIGGCAKGALIAEAIYLTGGSLGLHSGGGWGSLFVSSAPTNAAGGIYTGQLPAGQSGIGLSVPPPGTQGGLGLSAPAANSGFVLDPALSSTSNVGLGISSSTGGSYSLTNGALQQVTIEGGKPAWKFVGTGLEKAQQGAQAITSLYTAGQVVNVVFEGDRHVRANPSVDSTSVRTLEAGESLRIVGVTTDNLGNVWGQTGSGENIMLNSPDGINPAIISGEYPI